jgi:quercetin dioxygenase-like cupin family protein
MRISRTLALSVPFLTTCMLANEANAADAYQTIPDPGKLQWADTGPPFPDTKITVLNGDPSKTGAFVARWRCPDNYKIAPHTHPAAEAVTVLQGTFHIGKGETFDAAALTPVATGGFMVMPGNTAHYGMCQGDTIIEMHASGPWGTKMLSK